MEDVTANKRKMKELEDNLLYRLTSTQVRLNSDNFFWRTKFSEPTPNSQPKSRANILTELAYYIRDHYRRRCSCFLKLNFETIT